MANRLHHLVEAAAERSPDAMAFRFGKSAVTYEALARKTSQLAHVLTEHGVRRGDRVAIYLNKSLESALAIYGAMKAGAAYVPIDPGAPIERARAVMAQCGVAAIITHAPKVADLTAILSGGALTASLRLIVGSDSLPGATVPIVSWSDIDEAPPTSSVKTLAQDLAYIIFTSGSTGAPKGIMHTHQSGLAYAHAAAKLYDVSPGDRLSNHSPLHFDMSTFDYFCAPQAGACTTIIPEPYTKLPASLSQLIENDQLTHWYSVPYALIQLLERGAIEQRDWSALRWVMFGGEPFPAKHLRALMQRLPQARFANVYGPAEVNQCMHHEVRANDLRDDAPPPIGRVWDEAEHLIVDEADQPITDGKPGEVLIRSATMMRGYWERPDLNASAFYQRPVTSDVPDWFYRTGDIVETDATGVMRFAGRKDRQIKLRGFRVELDEVEAALSIHEAVDEAAAVALPVGAGQDAAISICAAVTVRSSNCSEVEPHDLQRTVGERLPSYAIPSVVFVLDAFPRTTSGKIDRRAVRDLLANKLRDDAVTEGQPQ